MQVLLNGKPTEVPDDATIGQIIRLTGLDRTPCAAEVNQTLIPRRDHEDARLAPGDRIELVTLVGGG